MFWDIKNGSELNFTFSVEMNMSQRISVIFTERFIEIVVFFYFDFFFRSVPKSFDIIDSFPFPNHFSDGLGFWFFIFLVFIFDLKVIVIIVVIIIFFFFFINFFVSFFIIKFFIINWNFSSYFFLDSQVNWETDELGVFLG